MSEHNLQIRSINAQQFTDPDTHKSWTGYVVFGTTTDRPSISYTIVCTETARMLQTGQTYRVFPVTDDHRRMLGFPDLHISKDQVVACDIQQEQSLF